MDTLIPGFYLWLGSLCIRIGGSEAEENLPLTGLTQKHEKTRVVGAGFDSILSAKRLISWISPAPTDKLAA